MSGIWGAAATLAAPSLRWHLRRRAARGKEDPARLPEREGHGAARPPGALLWLHAASVGESLSALPLLAALRARRPELSVLFTTGTVTAARVLEGRLPPGVVHRYAPLDVPAWAARFLDGWRPDAAAFLEAEIWPNTLAALRARGTKVALLNARMSARSFARWRRWAPGVARGLLGGYAAIHPRSAEDAARLAALGARHLAPPGDLKWAADPLPADPAALAALRDAIGGRPCWVAASTHPGEEALALDAAARAGIPGLLTVLAPRHPERGAEVAALCGAPRRALGAPPGPHPAYVADTVGEMGLWYRLAGAALVGKTLLPPGGGQNPLEPARLGCPVLSGPLAANFAEADAALEAAGALRRVADSVSLAEALRAVLTDPAAGGAMRAAAQGVAASAADVPERLAAMLLGLLRG